MTYPDAKNLIQSYNITYWLITKQCEGLSHADSLLQLPFRANCLNWVLGHILVSRNAALKILGETPVWKDEIIDLYKSESKPITNEENAYPLESLLKDLSTTQTRITKALEQISTEGLAKAVENASDKKSVGTLLAGLHWHETYHTGQLEILRQLAGKDDAIV